MLLGGIRRRAVQAARSTATAAFRTAGHDGATSESVPSAWRHLTGSSGTGGGRGFLRVRASRIPTTCASVPSGRHIRTHLHTAASVRHRAPQESSVHLLTPSSVRAQGGDGVTGSGLYRHAGSLLGAGAAGGLTVRHKNAGGSPRSSSKQLGFNPGKAKKTAAKGDVWGLSAKQQAFKRAHEELDELCLVRAPRGVARVKTLDSGGRQCVGCVAPAWTVHRVVLSTWSHSGLAPRTHRLPPGPCFPV